MKRAASVQAIKTSVNDQSQPYISFVCALYCTWQCRSSDCLFSIHKNLMRALFSMLFIRLSPHPNHNQSRKGKGKRKGNREFEQQREDDTAEKNNIVLKIKCIKRNPLECCAVACSFPHTNAYTYDEANYCYSQLI